MNDAISRNSVLEILRNEYEMAREERTEADNAEYKMFNSGEIHCAKRSMRKIAELPTLDVVPVIRCKDCIHRHSSEFCECRDGDAFCSDGE